MPDAGEAALLPARISAFLVVAWVLWWCDGALASARHNEDHKPRRRHARRALSIPWSLIIVSTYSARAGAFRVWDETQVVPGSSTDAPEVPNL